MSKLVLTDTTKATERMFYTVLLYGPNGSGKTQFGSTWPFPVYLTPTMALNELRTVSDLGLPVVTFDTIAEFKDQVAALASEIKAGKFQAKTIIVDNLTTIQTLFEAEIKAQSGVDKLEWSDWGRFTTLFVTLMTILHRLPCHILWITHADPEKTFTLKGDSRNFIPANCDLLLYSASVDLGATKGTDYRLHARRCGQWPARLRLPRAHQQIKPLTVISDPHYDKLAPHLGLKSQAEEEGVE